MRQTSFAAMSCSLARTLEVVGDWWSPLVLRSLWLGVDRFDQLVADLGISRNLLAARLAALEEGGVVARRPYQDHPVRHRYELTAAGRELVPVLAALTAWGDRWTAPEGGPPLVFRHAACGRRTVPTVCCSACGESIGADDLEPRPGPGGRAAPGTAVVAGLVAERARARGRRAAP